MKLLALCLAIALAAWLYLRSPSPRYVPTRYVGADDEGDALPPVDPHLWHHPEQPTTYWYVGTCGVAHPGGICTGHSWRSA